MFVISLAAAVVTHQSIMLKKVYDQAFDAGWEGRKAYEQCKADLGNDDPTVEEFEYWKKYIRG
jgi:hypothetical protein